jgi:hypothetical protein
MLSRFTRAVTGGALSIKTVLFGVSQFFMPVAVLLCCALLFPKGLMWSGIGMAAVLVFSAFTKFMTAVKHTK